MTTIQRDYKTRPGQNAKRKSGGSTLVGIAIGLILGLVIAVAVAMYLNRGPKPFADKTAQKPAATKADTSDPNKPLFGKDAKSGPAPKEGEKSADGKDERFSFYKILPGQEEAKVGDSKDAKVPPKDSKDGAKEAAKDAAKEAAKDAPKDAPKEQYFLQAGAFASAGDADNQKAKLALMGFEAKVETAEVDGKGTMHRVRLGPYGRLDDINRVRSTLATNGVDASLVKAAAKN
jgi:cell division protein FtsN